VLLTDVGPGQITHHSAASRVVDGEDLIAVLLHRQAQRRCPAEEGTMDPKHGSGIMLRIHTVSKNLVRVWPCPCP
jgi:hypothetical protein